MKIIVCYVLSSFLIINTTAAVSLQMLNRTSFYRSYKCENRKCSRTNHALKVSATPSSHSSSSIEKGADNDNSGFQYELQNEHSTMASCRLSCDIYGALWPLPTGKLHLGQSYTATHPSKFSFNISSVPEEAKKFVQQTNEIFLRNLREFLKTAENNENEDENQRFRHIDVVISVNSSDLTLDWDTDESYTLELRAQDADSSINGTVEIVANTVYGARHGVETLIQLTAPVVKPDGGKGIVILKAASITDSPIFSHRGLLIDTSRNFVPVKDILRTIDGLSACKMNILHWHATDSQSFPLQLKRVPAMALYGAYSPEKIYTIADMTSIVEYAKARGVRVILELDAPSHSGSGWEWGEEAGLGHLAVCVNAQPWRQYCIQPPCGQLNPVNPNVYNVLRDIYKDFIDVWGPNEVFHMGGDEVFLPCWNSTKEIIEYMESRGMNRTPNDFHRLWSDYQESLLKIVDEERENAGGVKNVDSILWSSELTNPANILNYIDKDRYVIHTWVESFSSVPTQLLELGYRLIISTKNTWYLDHGVWGNTRFHSWRDVYSNRIPNQPGVLGGEVAMWGEYVDGGSFDPRIWPRAAAVAERLWSDHPHTTTSTVEPRLQGQRDRLMARGIHPDAIFAEWCAQHDRQCQ